MKDKIILIMFLLSVMFYLFFTYLVYHIKMIDDILLVAIKTNQEMALENYKIIHNWRVEED